MSGSFHMTKAEEFPKRLCDEEFVCVVGWIDRLESHRHRENEGRVEGCKRR